MARRVAADEKPYKPVEEGLVRSVLQPGAAVPPPQLQALPGRAGAPAEALSIQSLSREKRFLVTKPEEDRINGLVAHLAHDLGAPVKLSHLVRASIRLLLDHEGSILEAARTAPRLERPPNGDLGRLAEFERKLGTVLHHGLSRSGRQG